ncbi:MAG: VWA domain-containing protein [Sulfurisoma sp.]|nr:VWA domain-containing protein [Sulfurisoma sp.]
MKTRMLLDGGLVRLLCSFLFFFAILGAKSATAAPTVTIDQPAANASVSVDHATVSGSATAVGGGQGIDLVLVIDDSGSLTTADPTRERFNAVQQLMNSFAAGASVKVGLVFFASSASTAVQLSDVATSVGAINSAISSHGGPTGATAIGSGIRSALDEFTARGRSGATKVIVLFTDGDETMSSDPNGAATLAASQGVTVNVVALGSGATSANTAIATAGGGRLLSAADAQQLSDLFRSAQLVGIASITVTNTTTGAAAPNVSVTAGAYTAPVDLATGSNVIEVAATDSAGVTTRQQVTVTRQGSTVTPPPSRSVKLRPQVLMAGFDPMLIDITDTQFNILAVVRQGAAPIQSVNFGDNTGGFSTAMSLLGQLPDGDLVYGLPLVIQRGAAAGLTFPNLFGSGQGEYKITVVDSGQQEHSFPTVQFGNNVNLTSSTGASSAAAYNPNSCRRLKPQVLMAGFDPTLIDFADTQFKVKAIVRASAAAAIQSVTLAQNATSFAQAMSLESTLANGDYIYSMTLTFPRGSFPAGAFRDLWSTQMAGVFRVEVTDQAQQTHSFPALGGGNNQCI